jgi:CheY-like chemotaxis protein
MNVLIVEDSIISDAFMTRMDGFQLLRALKSELEPEQPLPTRCPWLGKLMM